MQTMTATEFEILLDRRTTAGVRKIAQALSIRTTGRNKPQLVAAIAQDLAAGNHPQAIVTYRLGAAPSQVTPVEVFETKTCQYSHHDFPADHASYTTAVGTVCGDHFEVANTL